MGWKCECGNESEPNPPDVLGFTLLSDCWKCRKDMPSPFRLWDKSKGNKEDYKNNLLGHKYIKIKDKK